MFSSHPRYDSCDQTTSKGETHETQALDFHVCLCPMACSRGVAQDLPKAKPEPEGFSAERLERLERIGAAVQRNIDENRLAGAVTLFMRHRNAVWFKGQGMMDREANKAMPTAYYVAAEG
jgi:hypothetical protein